MQYAELAAKARGTMGACKACPVCNGKACGNTIPGPGAKGTGTVAIRNYAAWQDVLVQMNTIHEAQTPDTHFDFFGHSLQLPVMIAPVGDVERHYGDRYTMIEYNRTILRAAHDMGTLAWTGDGLNGSIMVESCQAIGELDGCGVPTIKPWADTVVRQKFEMAAAAKPYAIAMDIDSVGLPFLKGQNPPAGPKTAEHIAALVEEAHALHTPFILKGVLSTKAALEAARAGVDGLVVSNHGGRVLDGVPATATVLPHIVLALRTAVHEGRIDRMPMILVDGGIRSGLDVARALALGADAVLIARSFVVAAYSGGEEGVRSYLELLQSELADTMEMMGAAQLSDLSPALLWSEA